MKSKILIISFAVFLTSFGFLGFVLLRINAENIRFDDVLRDDGIWLSQANENVAEVELSEFFTGEVIQYEVTENSMRFLLRKENLEQVTYEFYKNIKENAIILYQKSEEDDELTTSTIDISELSNYLTRGTTIEVITRKNLRDISGESDYIWYFAIRLDE